MDENELVEIEQHFGGKVKRKEIPAICDKCRAKFERKLSREIIYNEIELMQLKKEMSFDIFLPRSPHEFSSYLSTEQLFTSGFYGPCCVYARATLECLLQEDCLAQETRSHAFDAVVKRIKDPGRNPSVKDMLSLLTENGVWPIETKSLAVKIADNGDYVVHHRYDGIFSGKGLDELRFVLPKVKARLDNDGIVIGMEQDGYYEKPSYEINRSTEERRLSLESLRSLFKIFLVCRPAQTRRPENPAL
jgi:hypothetical protein